jgi:hypothetical protein
MGKGGIKMKTVIAGCLLAILSVTTAIADVRDCDQTLVQSTYSSVSADHLDFRLATLVTNESYDHIKHKANANATIYGIPIGGSYEDFQSNIRKSLLGSQSTLTRDQGLNVLWTGLASNANAAYDTCIEGVAFSSFGIHLAVKFATVSDITIIAKYVPGFNDPRTIKVQWTRNIKQKDGSRLPDAISMGGETVVVLARPNVHQTIAVSSSVGGDSVAIEPLPIPFRHKCFQQQGIYNFFGDGCGDNYANAGRVEIVKFGSGGSTVVPQGVPTYDAHIGFWGAGDFNGDGLTDLVHFVFGIPKVDPYVQVHFSKGGGVFAPPTPGFTFREHANPQHDYDAYAGGWSIGYDPSTKRSTLLHDPKLPDGRIHVWRSNGDGTFAIGVP